MTFLVKVDGLDIYKLLTEEKLNHHSSMVRVLEGEWFELSNGNRANQYMGINEITNFKEVYTNVFISNLDSVEEIEEEINDIINNEKIGPKNIEWSHIELIFTEKNLNNNSIFNFCEHTLYSTSIFKPLSSRENTRVTPPSDFNFRLATNKEDEQNIIDCLITAYFNGLHKNMKQQVNNENFIKNIKNTYSNFFRENRKSFVAELDKKFIGHGSFDVEVSKFNTNIKIGKLIDVLVIDGYNNRGISKYLTKLIEDDCISNDTRILTGTVESDNDFNKYNHVISSLQKEGWNISSYIFTNKLQ